MLPFFALVFVESPAHPWKEVESNFLSRVGRTLFSSEGLAKAQQKFFFYRDFDDLLHLMPIFELELAQYFEIEATRVFVDVGAHIGRYSLAMSEHSERVIAFEAEPRNFSVLCQNIRINNLEEKVRPILAACYDREGQVVELHLSQRRGAHSLVGTKERNSIYVKTATVDQSLRTFEIAYRKVGLMKIDVNGAEYEVLKGALNVLREGRPLIIVEITMKLDQIRELLAESGYELQEVRAPNYICVPLER